MGPIETGLRNPSDIPLLETLLTPLMEVKDSVEKLKTKVQLIENFSECEGERDRFTVLKNRFDMAWVLRSRHVLNEAAKLQETVSIFVFVDHVIQMIYRIILINFRWNALPLLFCLVSRNEFALDCGHQLCGACLNLLLERRDCWCPICWERFVTPRRVF